ncbi:MAG: sugar phosphate isomerase/epimerase [Chloroflexi bacterium]|nr:sugar phosphate isomerase/epimerase [Chloroflexota bacterium]
MDRRFTISGFGDEIDPDPDVQLATLAALGIQYLDLRGAWSRNILDFDAEDVGAMRRALDRHGLQVATIASPVGKSEIVQEAGYEEKRLTAAIGLAEAFGTPLIRIFSFYHASLDHATSRAEVLARLERWASRAEAAGVTLLLENEVNLWGDTPERCREILEAVNSPNLRMTLDTGNFAAIGVASYDTAYPRLRPWLAHIQIKDVRTVDHAIVPAGEGDGQIPQVLRAAYADGYHGFLSLEPHLASGGRLGGFSGPDLFGTATQALRRILTAVEAP